MMIIAFHLKVVAFLTEGIMLDQQGKELTIDVCLKLNHTKSHYKYQILQLV